MKRQIDGIELIMADPEKPTADDLLNRFVESSLAGDASSAKAGESFRQLEAELEKMKFEIDHPPDIDYRSHARAAGLDDSQLRLIEQLFNLQDSRDKLVAQSAICAACERIRQGRASMDAIQRLLDKRSGVESEIRAAFAGVTREGGISWSEGWAIDNAATDEECQAARLSDREQSWAQLVDDPKWSPENGPWHFLDGIGARYYLAPAMIQEARDGSIGLFANFLDHSSYEDELRSVLTPAQFAAIHHFLRYILEVMATFDWPDDCDPKVHDLAEKWNVKTP